MFKVSKSNKKKNTKHRKQTSKPRRTKETSKVENARAPLGPYGFTPEGKKKRILLNAFDMNGIGHTRLAKF